MYVIPIKVKFGHFSYAGKSVPPDVNRCIQVSVAFKFTVGTFELVS